MAFGIVLIVMGVLLLIALGVALKDNKLLNEEIELLNKQTNYKEE